MFLGTRLRGYLIGYDISNDKLRARIHRRVKRYSATYQLSVYELELTEAELGELLAFVVEIIDEQCDSFFVLKLHPATDAFHEGSSVVFPTQAIMVIS